MILLLFALLYFFFVLPAQQRWAWPLERKPLWRPNVAASQGGASQEDACQPVAH
jgi:hypothetical protein